MYGILPSDEASDRLILNLEEPHVENKPTYKQMKFIRDLEKETGKKFFGRTFAEAHEYISDAVEERERMRELRRAAILADNDDGIPANPFGIFILPEERGYPDHGQD